MRNEIAYRELLEYIDHNCLNLNGDSCKNLTEDFEGSMWDITLCLNDALHKVNICSIKKMELNVAEGCYEIIDEIQDDFFKRRLLQSIIEKCRILSNNVDELKVLEYNTSDKCVNH